MWSTQQQAVFAHINNTNRSAIVEAVAGSGKTTTIVEAARHTRGSVLFLAFNKAIADELKGRGLNARTYHSLTYGLVLRAMRTQSVDTRKTELMLKSVLGERRMLDEVRKHLPVISKLVGMAKQVGIGAIVQDGFDAWHAIADHHNIELDEDVSPEFIYELASDVLALGNRSNVVDFDDMLYLPVLMNLSLPRFDTIFVDEAQDTNAIQRVLLRKALSPTGRIIAVGDPAQAIYGFRGASSDSLDQLRTEFNCVTLPLSVTYRCAKTIVEHARQWVSHIEAAPNANEGTVEAPDSWDHTTFKPNDLIVCRTTAPLISLAFNLYANEVPAVVMGRDIGQGIKSLVAKLAKADESLKGIKAALTDWYAKQVALAGDDEDKVKAIQDRYAIVGMFIERADDLNDIYRLIEKLFSAPAGQHVTLATIHKSKGLEADTVYWLNHDVSYAFMARREWQAKQERNLCYVATTRAKSRLVLISDTDMT